MANTLTIAAAGSGKTSKLISEALAIEQERVLITTYTEANAEEIEKKIVYEVGCIPSNITVSTWFSMLIKHGIKPYQSFLFDFKVKGMRLMSKQSGIRFYRKGIPIPYSEEKDFVKHYFSPSNKVYSDKLAKLVIRLNTASEGRVLDRLISVFPNILVDECQDLAGFDLEIIKLIAQTTANLSLACDPRQVTYLTHNPKKYRKYRNGHLKEFIENECSKLGFIVDEESLSNSHRCNEAICRYSNLLYPDIKPSESSQGLKTDHDGIFFVTPDKVDSYLAQHSPTQLRWNAAHGDARAGYDVHNFGQAKGLSFDRVLIYPTDKMDNWLKDSDSELKDGTRAKLYVAITRAKHSVAIVTEKFEGDLPEYVHWY